MVTSLVRGTHGGLCVWLLIHSKVYLMKPYVIKFVSDLQKVDDFLKKLWILPLLKFKRSFTKGMPPHCHIIINQWTKFKIDLNKMTLTTDDLAKGLIVISICWFCYTYETNTDYTKNNRNCLKWHWSPVILR